jgi:hypothetical protein
MWESRWFIKIKIFINCELVINMTRYLKTNNSNWRKLCKKQIKYEQQEFKLDDKMQIESNPKKNEK